MRIFRESQNNSSFKSLIQLLNNYYKDPIMVLSFSFSQALFYADEVTEGLKQGI